MQNKTYTTLYFQLITDSILIYEDNIKIDNDICNLSRFNKPRNHEHKLVEMILERLEKREECYKYNKPFSDSKLNLIKLINPKLIFPTNLLDINPDSMANQILKEYRIEDRKIYIPSDYILESDGSKSLPNLLLTKLHNKLKREAGYENKEYLND